MIEQTWPPTGRPPTPDEIATGLAVINEDGSVSWSPTNADLDGTDGPAQPVEVDHPGTADIHRGPSGPQSAQRAALQIPAFTGEQIDALVDSIPDRRDLAADHGVVLVVDEIAQIAPDAHKQLRPWVDELIRTGRSAHLPGIAAAEDAGTPTAGADRERFDSEYSGGGTWPFLRIWLALNTYRGPTY